MAARVCLILIFINVALCSEKSSKTINEGLIKTFTTGMKFAKDFLGSESVALKVAEFVVRAFQPPVRRRPHNEGYFNNNDKDRYYQNNDYNDDVENNKQESQPSLDPLRHIVRLLGLQPPQMSAVAVNALLFVAQMISTFLSGPQKSRKPTQNEDTTAWILNKNSRTLQDLISTAKNESLPDMIEKIIGNEGSEEETSCVRLLVCKIIPFVTKMQKTVFGVVSEEEKSYRGSSVMYRHLPTAEEINTRSDFCERKHPECDLNS